MILDVLGSRPKLRLLRYLSTHDGKLTGRALAQAAGVDAKRAAEALNELAGSGMVQRRRAGRAFLYSINRDSYAVDRILLPAFLNERDWLQRLGEEILRSVPGIRSVILYGSWATRRATPESDVDLLLVTNPKPKHRTQRLQERIDEVRGRLTLRYGRSVSLLVLSQDEFRRRVRARGALTRDIIAHGRVLAGSSLAEMLGRK
jgi:predicted nucleotidyltransferase